MYIFKGNMLLDVHNKYEKSNSRTRGQVFVYIAVRPLSLNKRLIRGGDKINENTIIRVFNRNIHTNMDDMTYEKS